MAKKPNARTFGQDLMRGEHVVGQPDAETVEASGSSIFDPVLCELLVRWFVPPAGVVLDPFAGGSVRGIVASRLGRAYHGVELSARQVEANQRQADLICAPPHPQWYVGDSADIGRLCKGVRADFVLSCPPYADLERYSDDPRDLSTMAYPDFLQAYRRIVAETVALLRPDRFAAFVVGDLRDKDGHYRGFPWHTVQAFQDAGLQLWNEGVLVTAAGSLPLRARRPFEQTRKLGKSHQNLLVFLKGDAKRATEACGTVDVSWPDAQPEFEPLEVVDA